MFDEVFPDYLLYGMTYDEFWKGDPWLAKVYRDNFRIKTERENYNLWLQGLYIYDAVSVAINNNFSKRQLKYMEEPIRITPMTEEEKKAKQEAEKRKAIEELKKYASFFGKKFGGENG